MNTQSTTTVIPPEDPRRRLLLTGTHNLRDVGGYPTADGGRTRWRTLYRSDGLGFLTSADREVLQDHGLKTVIDLRDKQERVPAPDALDGMPIRQLSIPVFEDSLFALPAEGFPPLSDHYRRILERHPHQLAAVVGELAAAESLPAIVHCTAGKDRTGLTIAITLSLVGVPDVWIVRDYQASERILGQDFVRKAESLYDDAGFERSMLGAPTASPAEYLQSTLEALRSEYGSLERFVRAFGVDDASIARLREELVVRV